MIPDPGFGCLGISARSVAGSKISKTLFTSSCSTKNTPTRGWSHPFIYSTTIQCETVHQPSGEKKEEALILGYIFNQYGFYFSNKKLGDLVPLPNASLLEIMHPSEYLRLSPSPGKACGATQHTPSHLLGSTLEEFSCMSQRWRLHQHTGNEKQQVCETSVPTSHINLRDIFSR